LSDQLDGRTAVSSSPWNAQGAFQAQRQPDGEPQWRRCVASRCGLANPSAAHRVPSFLRPAALSHCSLHAKQLRGLCCLLTRDIVEEAMTLGGELCLLAPADAARLAAGAGSRFNR